MKILDKVKKRLGSENGHFATDLGFKAVTEIINAVFGIITFSVFARILTKSDYAIINQTIAVGTLLAPIILLRMDSAFCVFFPGLDDKKTLKSRYFSVMAVSAPICLVVFMVLVIGNGFFSNAMFGSTDFASYMWLMALYFILLSITQLTTGFFRAIKQIKKASVLLIIKTTLICGWFFVMALLKENVTLAEALLSYCAIELLIAIISLTLIYFYFEGVPLKMDIPPLKEYYKYALPLMPYLIMSWVNTFIGRFIMNHLMGLENSAIYGFNSSLVQRAFFMSTVIAYTIFPYISRYWNEGNKEKVANYLSKAFNIGIFFAFPITMGIVVTAPDIVKILGDGNYPVERFLIFVLCVGMIILMLYNVYSYLIDLSRKTAWYNAIFAVSMVVNIGLNYLLIPTLGMYGVAYSTLIINLITMLLTLIIGTKSAKIKLHFDWKYVLRVTICTAAMTGGAWLVYGGGGIIRFIAAIAVGIIVYFGASYLFARLIKKPII